jgi:16S rRNA G527 N7-methylase RsmG
MISRNKARSLDELIQQYLLRIEKWNKIHNLTAIRNPQDMLYQHVMDSLAVLPHIRGQTSLMWAAVRVCQASRWRWQGRIGRCR